MTAPKYRVRLFLSVDLTGSTAYKSNTPPEQWIRTFRKFYDEFPRHFTASYEQKCEQLKRMGTQIIGPSHTPKFWKTVGDEIIFVNRISSKMHLCALVKAFEHTLEDYRRNLKAEPLTSSLDVKGNGWIAAFPTPNQTIKIAVYGKASDQYDDELIDENDELAADQTPSKYEFIGSGIDYGFRISKNAAENFFTISPALAKALCFPHKNDIYEKLRTTITLKGVNQLKGVLSGASYPIIGINTEKNEHQKKLDEVEAKAMGISPLKNKDLLDYLTEFTKFHQIECDIKDTEDDDDDTPPQPYHDYLRNWRGANDQQDFNKTFELEAAENADKDAEGDLSKSKKFLSNP